MTNLKLKFYSVLKNEDAVPFIGDNILVVADGLGGAGSSIHAIDRQNHPDMNGDVWSSAFGDITDISAYFKQYADELVASITDDKDHTSALWASRIVIARCVYALTDGEFKDVALNDEKERARLAEFIAKGLHNVAEKFNLQKGKYDGQLLLPTTLAFIRFVEQDQSIIAETIWAGDSRCYALLPEGLKLLTIDDEDTSGSITNLFYADNAEVHLNYLQYRLNEPCILMAVSDGVFDCFDPYDHLGVEQIVLAMIAESNSEQELSEKLKNFFDKVHGDDATMSFVSFGFADFNELKNAFRQRTETILSIKQKQANMQEALEVMNLSENEAAHYVMSRATDRFEHIVPMLLDAIEHNQDDIAITDEILQVVNKANKEQSDEIERAKAEARKQALNALNKYVIEHPELVKTEILNKEETQFGIPELSSIVLSFNKIAGDLAAQYTRKDNFIFSHKRLEEQKQQLHREIRDRIDLYRKDFDDLWFEKNNKEVEKKRKDLCEILRTLYRMENSLKFSWELQDVFKLPFEERNLTHKIRKYVDKSKKFFSSVKNYSDKIKEYKTNYLQAWNKLFQFIVNSSKCEFVLSKTFRQKFGLNCTAAEDAIQPDRKAVRSKVMQTLREQKSAVASDIVVALAKHYDKTSVIDAQFNAGRLSLFRTYYRLKCQPDDSVRDFYDSLAATEMEYTSLIEQCKK